MTQSLPPKSLVLYADDDPDDIDLVKEAFKEFPGAEVISFVDGEALLEYAEHLLSIHVMPCLIVLDINMPRMNGKETLRRLRTLPEYNNTPIILFSTSTLPSETAFAKSFNAGYITKPLHSAQIEMVAEVFINHCADDVKRRLSKGKKGRK